MVEQTDIRPGHYMLDLGCGTATLAIMRADEPWPALIAMTTVVATMMVTVAFAMMHIRGISVGVRLPV